MHTLLVDSAVSHDEVRGSKFNIIICAGYSLVWQPDAACDAFGEAREVVAPSCVCET
ncbi:hypothetical protein BDN71DRAFT_1455122, partial [Pleurotus eryngii]